VDVLAMRAIDHLNHQRFNDAARDARNAIDVMAQRPEVAFTMAPWGALLTGLGFSGHVEELEGVVDDLVAAARATGDDAAPAEALALMGILGFVADDAERTLPVAEEAVALAQRLGYPTLIVHTSTLLAWALETIDPPRARALLETAIEVGAAAGDSGFTSRWALANLARLDPGAMTPEWANRFRRGLAADHEVDLRTQVLAGIDVYAQALAHTDWVETAAVLVGAVGALAPWMANPLSVAHHHQITERLRARLGDQCLAELTAHGAGLDYEHAVALAFAELDRMIDSDGGEPEPVTDP
jgi:hypothetical protein